MGNQVGLDNQGMSQSVVDNTDGTYSIELSSATAGTRIPKFIAENMGLMPAADSKGDGTYTKKVVLQ